MSQESELDRAYSSIRLEARAATNETFQRYEELWRAARRAGRHDLATRVLNDLVELTEQLDPATARLLADAAQRSGAASVIATPVEPATNASSGAPNAVDLTVVVVGVAPTNEAPAVRSLGRQTLAASRFETRFAPQADGPSLNRAIETARGRVVLFVEPDVELAPDALERHVAAHSGPNAAPRAVLGRVDVDGLELRPLSWALDRMGLAGCQHGTTNDEEVPGECFAFAHASVPRATLEKVGGCDSRLAVFAAAELGARLAASGVAVVLAPSIGARRPATVDLDGWLARGRAMGGEWCTLQRKHGDQAPPTWLRSVGLEERAVEPLLERLLDGADRQARGVAALRDSIAEIERVLARKPAEASATLERIADDLVRSLLEVTRHELARGFVNAALGGDASSLERCAATGRGAAVLVLASDRNVAAVGPTLAELPNWAQLVVAGDAAAIARPLPDDRRLVRLEIPSGGSKTSLARALLASSGADLFVLLDGSCAPTRAEWEALRLTLSTLPAIGACDVGETSGALAKARLAATLPTALVAVRRDVVESDSDAGGSFLDRLVQRGYRLATTCASRELADATA
jgi:hypothetical protein